MALSGFGNCCQWVSSRLKLVAVPTMFFYYSEKSPLIQAVIDSGAVPDLISFLSLDSNQVGTSGVLRLGLN